MKLKMGTALFALMTIAAAFNIGTQAQAADELKLKKGISFVQDTDSGFPIEAG